jgi:limonene-1,2-epoxide hydrolase
MSGVGDTPSAEEVVRDFMAAFTAAWPTGDAATLSRYFSENAEYRNGPREAVIGRVAITADLAGMMGLGGEVDADVRHLLSDGTVVMTERVDYVRLDAKTTSLRIAGLRGPRRSHHSLA